MKDKEVKGRKILGSDELYYTPPEAADMMDISTTTLRGYLTKEWLNSHNIEVKQGDLYKTPGNHYRIISSLVKKISDAVWKPIV